MRPSAKRPWTRSWPKSGAGPSVCADCLSNPGRGNAPRCGEPAPVLERHCTEEEDPYCCWLVFSCPACGEVVDEDPGDG